MRYNSISNELSLSGSEIFSLINFCKDYQFDEIILFTIFTECIRNTIGSNESYDSKTKFIINFDPDVPFHFFSKNVIGRDRYCVGKKNG